MFFFSSIRRHTICALVTGVQTCALPICPANPTGGVTPRAEVDRLVEGLAAHPDITILSDEIYSQMLYDGREHASLLQYPELRDRVIMLDGWSTTYAMTGWRLGFAVWPKPPIGSASGRERVCTYVLVTGVAVYLKKKKNNQ